ncbi:hypothetical protein AAF712_014938 [Marasmius tenuissimus]|uniref:Uncharacterized protein n=1 Tax=Marasmius tenuissimus TaxID=585030 RepID=A0ABR2Z9N5_9AGAR
MQVFQFDFFLGFFLALLDKLRHFFGLPTHDSPGHHDPHFNGDVDRWSESMQYEFRINNVTDINKTMYAIETGLKSNPEVQQAMGYRLGNFTTVRSNSVWPWTDFVYDLRMINDEARKLQQESVTFTTINLNIPYTDVAKLAIQGINIGVEGVQERFSASDIHSRIDALSTLPRIPNWDEVYERIKPFLDNARRDLERLVKDGKATFEDVCKAIHDFIQVQLELLPKEFQRAIQEFHRFKSEHPYIVAGAEIALVVIGTEIILPYAFLGLLRLIGFSEIGPVAGAWAPAIQSAFYGGRTGGLFSILQKISMTGRLVWPLEVFTDITAAVGGTIVVMPPGEIKRLVEGWAVDQPFPVNLALENGNVVAEGFETWMKVMKERMEEAHVPHAQWLDVAIEALRQRIEGFIKL